MTMIMCIVPILGPRVDLLKESFRRSTLGLRMGIYGFRIAVGRLCRRRGNSTKGLLDRDLQPGDSVHARAVPVLRRCEQDGGCQGVPSGLGVRLPAFHSHHAAGNFIEQLLPDGIRHDWWMMVVSFLVLGGGGAEAGLSSSRSCRSRALQHGSGLRLARMCHRRSWPSWRC